MHTLRSGYLLAIIIYFHVHQSLHHPVLSGFIQFPLVPDVGSGREMKGIGL